MIKSSQITVKILALLLILTCPTASLANEDTLHETKTYGIELSPDKPQFTKLWLDSLGKSRKAPTEMLDSEHKQNYKKETKDGWIIYSSTERPHAKTSFKFEDNQILIRSESKNNQNPEPFVLKFKSSGPNPAYATLLGKMNDCGCVKIPAILHIPGQGTMRITATSADNQPLFFEYNSSKRKHITVTFPAASRPTPWIEFKLEVISVYPPIPELQDDPRFDGYRRCWLNILQFSDKHRVLSNHTASDVCALCYHEYSEIAMLTPQLAEGVSGPQLIRDSLDRILAGKKTYAMPGYYFGDYPVTSLDTWPALLTAAHNYYQVTNDKEWVKANIDKLLEWGSNLLSTDSNNNGLIEYIQSGNTGQLKHRPANWWDCINFGHEDAYSNAIAYRAFRGLAKMAKVAGKNSDAKKYDKASKKLKTNYYKTFYNPQTKMLAGWKSKDGQLHDYAFTFIQGMAITYGLVDDEKKANALIDATLAKMKEVGFNRFDLGLPGNLIVVPQEDYHGKNTRWGAQGNFQVYENGGASANHTYFFLAALYKLGRQQDGDKILLPLLNSFNERNFQGDAGNRTKDWRAWDGTCHGYEGILVDGYLAVKAVLVRQNLIDTQWGTFKKK